MTQPGVNATPRPAARALERGETPQVLIVGAGPVGLFLGCCLALRGVSFGIVEARSASAGHSRAIGVHPPALERLAAVGLAEAMLARGVPIRRGLAFAGRRRLGAVAFSSCPPPYAFVLSLPQIETEALLAARLERLAPGTLERGLRLVSLREDAAGVTLGLEGPGGPTTRRAAFVVGCDGSRSAVRRLAGFGWRGGSYPDRYLMGDFADHTDLGTDAAIHLCGAGLVESFPLPGARRRWVLRRDARDPAQDAEPSAEGLAASLLERLGHAPDPASHTMLSAFGIERRLATPLARGRVLLAGDAAHVVSPIGGQGMNLGWLDAWDAAATLEGLLGRGSGSGVEAYARRRTRAAREAARRAAFNTLLGRRTRFGPLRAIMVRLMLRPPFARAFARRFTMRGL